MTEGLVAGRFRIQRLLGSGGTASVFAAEDTRTGQQVALKLLHPHLAVERSVWDAFFEEVNAAQSVDHPGLAEIFDAGVEDSDPPIVWIAMERVEGVSLAEHVRVQGPLDVAQAVALISAVLDALAAAHEGGIVHRDVTPANVMLAPELLAAPFDPDAFGRSIRLLDFGLADVPGRSTVGADALLSGAVAATEGVVASVPYASPEQLSGLAVREASDLYQVGATLHFALTGQAPYVGTTSAVVRAHLSGPPPVPSAIRRGLPRAIDRLVTTAMLKRPDDRYADAAAMRMALITALEPPTASLVVADAMTDVSERAVDGATGVTRMYRTSVPAEVLPAPSPALVPDSGRGGGWQAWAVGAGVIAVLTAIVGLSAMAASTSPPPVVASPSATFTPPPTVETPVVTEAPDPTTSVPELAGLTVLEARAALERVGLLLGEVTRENSPSVVDTVLASSPSGGQFVDIGDVVALRVASGDSVVPAVVGLSASEAAVILSAAGFPSHVTEIDGATPGIVTGSMPGVGETSRVGTTVILTVPRARVISTPSPSPTSTPTTGPTPEPSGSGPAVP